MLLSQMLGFHNARRNECVVVWYKYETEHTGSLLAPIAGMRGQSQETIANDLVNAAQGLLYNDQRSLRTAGVIT